MIDQNIATTVADLLISIDAVTFRFDPPYTYTTGMKSPIYLDNRLVLSYPKVRSKIVDIYAQLIKEKIGLDNVNWISATATAAVPHGSLIADRLNLPMVFVRPTTKAYGKGNRMEGYLEKGAKVVIIEDHISTAQSVVGNALTIRENGGEVHYCVSTTTYETEISKKALEENKITLIPLTTGKIIVERAFATGKITQEQKESIDAWFIDPLGWAKKFGFE